MGVEAIYFFGHIRLHRQNRNFLCETRLIHFGAAVHNARDSGLKIGAHLGGAIAKQALRVIGQAFDLVQLARKNAMKRGAFSGAHIVETAEQGRNIGAKRGD